MTTQRLSTIRVLNITVGIVTSVVGFIGMLAWHSSHTPPPLTSISPPFPAGNPS